jgi:uncharacterized protein
LTKIWFCKKSYIQQIIHTSDTESSRPRNLFIRWQALPECDGIMQPAAGGSVSRFRLDIEIVKRGSASCELVRHLAPLTSNAILKNLPLQDRVHRYADKFAYIETGLVIGAEKQRTQFKRGDVAYLTSNGSICVFVKDAAAQPMNPIGAVVSNLEVVEACQPGDVMVVKKPPAVNA